MLSTTTGTLLAALAAEGLHNESCAVCRSGAGVCDSRGRTESNTGDVAESELVTADADLIRVGGHRVRAGRGQRRPRGSRTRSAGVAAGGERRSEEVRAADGRRSHESQRTTEADR